VHRGDRPPGTNTVVDESEREEAAVSVAVRDLVRRFGDAVPQAELESAARSCFANWSDARIRDFVPILAERCARERVAKAERERGH
jgi:hypothetical protein